MKIFFNIFNYMYNNPIKTMVLPFAGLLLIFVIIDAIKYEKHHKHHNK